VLRGGIKGGRVQKSEIKPLTQQSRGNRATMNLSLYFNGLLSTPCNAVRRIAGNQPIMEYDGLKEKRRKARPIAGAGLYDPSKPEGF
jgi:hypothetical protein